MINLSTFLIKRPGAAKPNYQKQQKPQHILSPLFNIIKFFQSKLFPNKNYCYSNNKRKYAHYCHNIISLGNSKYRPSYGRCHKNERNKRQNTRLHFYPHPNRLEAFGQKSITIKNAAISQLKNIFKSFSSISKSFRVTTPSKAASKLCTAVCACFSVYPASKYFSYISKVSICAIRVSPINKNYNFWAISKRIFTIYPSIVNIPPMHRIIRLSFRFINSNLYSLANSNKPIFKSLSVIRVAASLTVRARLLFVSITSSISKAIRVSPNSFLHNLILLFLNSTTLNIGMQPFKGLTNGA